MARPDDIAAHIWAEAERLAKEDGYLSLESSYDRAQYCRAARKVLAERERCAKACEAQKAIFQSDEYATPQPAGSLSECFAVDECIKAIREGHQ